LEYSLLAVSLAISLVAALMPLGDEVNGFYNAVDQALAALEL
jgi:Flp pilus assembly pilin Flp